jgi:hypothetical protein
LQPAWPPPRKLGLLAEEMPPSSTSARTTRHRGYAVSQQKRKRIEEPFGWGKTIGGLARPMLRGVKKLGFKFTLTMASYNLIRPPKPSKATA